MRKLYIEITESQINFIKEKGSKNLDVFSVKDIDDVNQELRLFLRKNVGLLTTCQVVISSSQVLLKQDTVPQMNKHDLYSYITNNIGDYFTFDNDRHDYTYRIIKKYKKQKEKLLDILIYAIPFDIISTIKILSNSYNLKIANIEVYPFLLYKKYQEKNNVSVIEVSSDRVDFLSMNNGNFFMYASDPFESLDSKNEARANAIFDNINGYMNFFSIKHFGEKIKKLYLASSVICEDTIQSLSDLLKEYNPIIIKNEFNHHEVNRFSSIKLINRFKNKDIKEFILKGYAIKEQKNLTSILLAGILALVIIVTFFLPVIQSMKLDMNLQSINTQIDDYRALITSIEGRDQLQSEVVAKQKIIKDISSKNIDYTKVCLLFAGLPSEVYYSNITIDENLKINVTFNVTTTKDATTVISYLKEIKTFEKIEVDSVNINDQEQQMSFNLEVLKNKKKDFLIREKW